MIQPSYKSYFSRALTLGGAKLHLAAHSHHLWPDVTEAAHAGAWRNAATNWDGKWAGIMGQAIPEAQSHIARHLHLSDPASITFAPNTHEFVLRLFSALKPQGARILTTDSEFFSFARQADRLAEDRMITLEKIPTEPFATFRDRFMQAAATGNHDMVFLSQVFFNSGYAVQNLPALVSTIPNPDALVVVDGYHGFMAIPTDLAPLEKRIFYLGGGYKYAMAGEGACFLVCPPGYAPRPRNTGWYAAFGTLADPTSFIPYAQDGARFFGATFDPSGLYRLNAVMRLLQTLGVTAADIHARVIGIQTAFIAALDQAHIPGLTTENLIIPAPEHRGNFLAYRSPHAAAHQARLAAAHIITDVRGDVLRCGFGLYHDLADVPGIVDRIMRLDLANGVAVHDRR